MGLAIVIPAGASQCASPGFAVPAPHAGLLDQISSPIIAHPDPRARAAQAISDSGGAACSGFCRPLRLVPRPTNTPECISGERAASYVNNAAAEAENATRRPVRRALGACQGSPRREGGRDGPISGGPEAFARGQALSRRLTQYRIPMSKAAALSGRQSVPSPTAIRAPYRHRPNMPGRRQKGRWSGSRGSHGDCTEASATMGMRNRVGGIKRCRLSASPQ